MAKNDVRAWDNTASNNTDVGGIGIQGTNLPSNFDNALREIMKQVADVDSGAQPLNDTFTLCDPSDTTKRARFDCVGITTATTRVFTMPDVSGTIPMLSTNNSWSGENVFSDIRVATGARLDFTTGGNNDYISYDDTTNTYSFFSDTSVAGTIVTTGMIRLTDTTDASLSSTGHAFQIGATAGANLIADGNEIMARDNGSAASLNLNLEGGVVNVGAGGLSTTGDLLADGSLFSAFNSPPTLTSSTAEGGQFSSLTQISRSAGTPLFLQRTTSDGRIQEFYRQNTRVGDISVTTTATAFNTSSDYRLKTAIEDLKNSGAFIDALRPRKGKWIVDGSLFVGFLAHEFAEVSPSSVTGVKDEVDEDGNPVMQAMQASSAEVIANIIAELQDLRKRVSALEA